QRPRARFALGADVVAGAGASRSAGGERSRFQLARAGGPACARFAGRFAFSDLRRRGIGAADLRRAAPAPPRPPPNPPPPPALPTPAFGAPPPMPPPFELSAPGEGFSDLAPSGASGHTAAPSAPLEAEEPFFRSQGEDEDTGKIHLPQQVMAKGTKVRLVFVAGLAFVGLAVLVTFKVGSSSRPRAKVTSSLMPAMPPKPAGTSTPAQPPRTRASELPAKP